VLQDFSIPPCPTQSVNNGFRHVRLPNKDRSEGTTRQLVKHSLETTFIKSANAADLLSFQVLRSVPRCDMIEALQCVAVHLFAVEFHRQWIGQDITVWVRGLKHNLHYF
jgi:hypothetical protein